MKTLLDADAELVTWWGTRAECISALNRRRREGSLSPTDVTNARTLLEHLSGSWTEMQPTERLRLLAENFMDTHPLKAPDAMQLAAAFRWSAEKPDGYEFVSLDGTLRGAAASTGFTILPADFP